MKIANLNGRLQLLDGMACLDVHDASGGQFDADPQSVYAVWDEFRKWAAGTVSDVPGAVDLGPDTRLGSPVPRPGQVFGIGNNYREHSDDISFEHQEHLTVFTKFPSAITGPYDSIVLPSSFVDWEAEMVVVMGREARHVGETEAWSYVAGVSAGQDLSERQIQSRPAATPQYSLGKSFAGFAPIGPVLTTPDEYDNPNDIALTCLLNGERMQSATTSTLVTSVPGLICQLSEVVTLWPGDIIFTGTPPGFGYRMDPPRYLAPGDVLETLLDGVGVMRQVFVSTDHLAEPFGLSS